MLANHLLELFSTDLGIDLGTANTLVFMRNRGIVLNDPSIIAVRRTDGAVIGVGREAKAMLGRAPENIRVIRPLKDGVIADFDTTQKMLRYFILAARRISTGRRRGWGVERPRVVIGVRSEEHTSELQSQSNLVCRLLLEKKKTEKKTEPQDDHLQE